MNSETSYVCLFYAVLFAGAMTLSPGEIEVIFDGKDKELVMDQLLDATNASLCIFNFPGSPTTDALIAFLLVHSCPLEEERLPSQNVVGVAMRAAQTMGMHRDGGLFGLTDLECETRRRIWWYIMYRDTITAVQTGLPPQGGSNEDLYDTKMVSELQDMFIKVEEEELPRDISSNLIRVPSEQVPLIYNRESSVESKEVSPIMLAAIGRYEITKFLHKIVCRQLSIRPVTQDDVLKMACLNSDLLMRIKYLIGKIQKCMHISLGTDTTSGGSIIMDGTYFDWACEMLRFQCGIAGTLFYQPFLKNPKAKSWIFARDCGISTCQQFLDAFVKLYTNPEFRPWNWHCPGVAQLQHAVTILIIDLHERTHTEEAPESRRLVDAVFTIYDRSEEQEYLFSGENKFSNWQALMRKSAQEWEMLRRFRNDAYHRAGLQPTGESLIQQVGASPPTVLSDCSQSSPISQHHEKPELPNVSRMHSPQSVERSSGHWVDNGTIHHNTPTDTQPAQQDLVSDQRIAQMVREQYLAATSETLTTTQSLIMTTDAIPAPVFPQTLLNMIDEIDYNWGEWSHQGNYMMQMPPIGLEQRANMRFDYNGGGH